MIESLGPPGPANKMRLLKKILYIYFNYPYQVVEVGILPDRD